jgi:hypothetical protein
MILLVAGVNRFIYKHSYVSSDLIIYLCTVVALNLQHSMFLCGRFLLCLAGSLLKIIYQLKYKSIKEIYNSTSDCFLFLKVLFVRIVLVSTFQLSTKKSKNETNINVWIAVLPVVLVRECIDFCYGSKILNTKNETDARLLIR